MDFEKLVKEFSDLIKSEVKTETVIGQQFTLGEFTCVPVIRVGIGFGGGGGTGNADVKAKAEGTGGAGGAGFGIQPIGFLVTKGDKIEMISVEKGSSMNSLFEKAPGLIEKFFDAKAKAGATNA